MPSSLAEHPLSLAWLRQFDARSIHTARLLLQSLKLVSLQEFETTIARQVQSIVDSTEGRIAIFAIDKDPGGEARLPSSADRLGHCLTNLERLLPHRIRAKPSVASMRAEKVRHVVLVDDLLGSGGRLRRFWKAWASKSLKSWLSSRFCQLWVVCYAAHNSGLRAGMKRITYLNEDHVLAHVRLHPDAAYWPGRIEELCEEYAQRTAKARAASGVGGVMCPIVFQHGCPNNCPAILWAEGKTWRALFPNRAIDPQLFPCFDAPDDSGRNPELLWNAGQYRLALSLINDLAASKKSRTHLDLIAVLGLVSKGVRVDNLDKFLLLPGGTIQTLIAQARELGLLSANSTITDLGRDIVERSKGAFMTPQNDLEVDEEAEQFYIPAQFRGVRRKSSTSRI